MGAALSWWGPAKSRHHAFPPVPFRRGHPNLRATVPAATNLGPRWDAADRRDPGPWPAYRDEPVADHGAERGAALRQLPSRAQPRGLEQPCGIPLAARFADHHPHARGPVVLGLDDTIERRRGKRISAKGIYRDPVRSSKAFFVKTSGLRWLSLMLLAPVPWAGRVWALPFLTALAPSERCCSECGRRHKTLTDWARQVALQARRWLPGRELVLIGDSAFAALELLAALARHGVTCITRLRLDAALSEPAPPRKPGTRGRPRTKGQRLASLSAALIDTATQWQRITVPSWYGGGERTVEIHSSTAVCHNDGRPTVPIRWVLLRDPQGRFDPQALLCTDLTRDPLQILTWFVQRWQVEVTFRDVRDHLGVETQRQWSDKAIARTTP